ncbi:MAG: hypothetical protein KA527_06065 [Cytophagaceae bacterium]|jgi:cytoskeletal protein RodZ|nr:hypothetical protein [Cytophagaceae bacterium]MBP6093984.1 hypothetical protein [Cytophagaceae bacterium]
MKKPNNTSWEALEKAWQKQIQAQESDIPANMWERMEQRMDEKPVRPLWLRMNTWVWSAAAVLAVIIGLNWEGNVEMPQQSNTIQQAISSGIKSSAATNTLALAVREPNTKPQPISNVLSNQAITPAAEPIVIQKDPQPQVAQAEKAPEQPEEVWVRIDIDPVEETAKSISVAQREDVPVLTKKKTFVGRLLKQVKQVVAGEQLDWQELKEGNRSLEDGIHQVANTYYRTEQTVKQTFQIQ